uniref:Uncharacterized protein n=1 Tax=Rhizophora mucronata TaxID=61149 RepID=A0A2P2Q671_RHIMU
MLRSVVCGIVVWIGLEFHSGYDGNSLASKTSVGHLNCKHFGFIMPCNT